MEDTSNNISFYTIYDHPKDAPEVYACRKWYMEGLGFRPDKDIFMTDTDLENIRKKLSSMGLTPISREPGDDPVIIESWI